MASDQEINRLLDALHLEYNALRSDIVHRSSARFSMLSVGLGVFALGISLTYVEKGPVSLTIAVWVTVAVLVVYLFVLWLAWRNAGKSIARLSLGNRSKGGGELSLRLAECAAV